MGESLRNCTNLDFFCRLRRAPKKKHQRIFQREFRFSSARFSKGSIITMPSKSCPGAHEAGIRYAQLLLYPVLNERFGRPQQTDSNRKITAACVWSYGILFFFHELAYWEVCSISGWDMLLVSGTGLKGRGPLDDTVGDMIDMRPRRRG